MRLWLAAALFWTFLILVMCWIPMGFLFIGGGGEHPKAFRHLDKVVHAGVFVVFGLLWLRVIPGNARFFVVLAAGLTLAAATEYGQSLPIVGRDGDVVDGLSDMAGVVLAYPLFLLLSRRARDEKPVAAVVTSG